MARALWVNLPVKNVTKSREFFIAIGFKVNEKLQEDADSCCIMVGDNNFVIMLFENSVFKSFVNSEICNTAVGSEVLFSLDAESKEDVDLTASKIVNAGGKIFAEPALKDGWMYGCGFSDLDGHRWNLLYMDMGNIK